MNIDAAAGKPADRSKLVNVPKLITAYYEVRPDPGEPGAARRLRHVGPSRLLVRRSLQRMAYPGHQPSDLRLPHGSRSIDGPLFLGIDTHALVGAGLCERAGGAGANGVDVMLAEGTTYTPTPRSPTQFCATTAAGERVWRTAS